MVYKNGLKEYLIICVVGGGAFGLIMGMLMSSLLLGVFMGLLYGLLFTGCMALVLRSQEKKAENIRFQISHARRIICEGPANQNNVAGWLFLTDSGLEFYPIGALMGGNTFMLPRDGIARVETKFNKIIVYNSWNQSFTFVVNKPAEWQRTLMNRAG